MRTRSQVGAPRQLLVPTMQLKHCRPGGNGFDSSRTAPEAEAGAGERRAGVRIAVASSGIMRE